MWSVVAGQRSASRVETAQQCPVVTVVSNVDTHPAQDRRVDSDLHGHLPPVHLRESGTEAIFLHIGQWSRDSDMRDLAIPALGGQLNQPGQRRAEVAPAEASQGQVDQPYR